VATTLPEVKDANVVILVPRRAGVRDRDRLWEFARAWWANDHPNWRIVEGHHNDGPFNRGAAINTAARDAGNWDVAVIIDSDVIIGAAEVRDGVALARRTNRMVLGYDVRIHLQARGTKQVLGGFRGDWTKLGHREREHALALTPCSSCVIVSRALWDRTGGYDERFVGWGWEDVAFRVTCETLTRAEMLKMHGTLFHLWHMRSDENHASEITFMRNRMRGTRYRAARFDIDALRLLLNERDTGTLDESPGDVILPPSRIPRILHRTVPKVSEMSDEFWLSWRQLLPGWELMTHRDPLDPLDWPETGDLWQRCANGAQKAGLIRLEALSKWGGVYVDSDVEPYRSLEPLLDLHGFAAWEDMRVIPDAVMGFEAGHLAVRKMLTEARASIERGEDAWKSGPGVSTSVLAGRRDVLLLPPGSFYPYHYNEQNRRGEDHMTNQPWSFGAHHWEGSWLTAEQQRAARRRLAGANVR